MSWPMFDFSTAPPYQQVFDYTGGPSGQPVYIGWATPGVATSAAKWRIRKLTYSGSTVVNIQFANADVGFNSVWDDRASYTYS